MSNLYGLIGETLSHSLSPKIHNIFMTKNSIAGSYQLFEVSKNNLATAIEGLKVLGARGVNITIPYKLEVIKYLDELSIEAQKIGSVNTIKFTDSEMIGYNTDYFGIDMTFKKYKINLKDKAVVVLGNGGAAVTLIEYLIDNGVASLTIVGRNYKKLINLNKHNCINIMTYDRVNSIKSSDIIINTTPCGMYPDVHSAPVEKQFISKFNVAFDLIYNPVETLFLKHSAECGLTTINGMYMLVSQAIAAQELWNGITASHTKIDEVYNEILGA
jgi:shikimate dehydrogenase